MKEYYDVIFKRRSMRKYDEALALSEGELTDIRRELDRLIPLVKGMDVRFEIVPRANTTAKFGEYCLLMYSEKKPHYLLNAGYMLEQMDLYLNSRDIGVCWYGLARTKKKEMDGLQYVIMLAFGKSKPEDFRTASSEFRRKSREEIFSGEFDSDVIEAVHLAPSACNSQPWKGYFENNVLRIFRNPKAKSIMPPSVKPFFNTIDMGIFLCFLEIALEQKGYRYERSLIETAGAKADLVEIALYAIK